MPGVIATRVQSGYLSYSIASKKVISEHDDVGILLYLDITQLYVFILWYGVNYMHYRPLVIDEIKSKIIPILKKYNIKKAAVFGSLVRREMHRGSDIDLIIDVGDLVGGLIFIEVKRKIENKLGRKVDLISYHSLAYSEMKDSILSEAEVIYEK